VHEIKEIMKKSRELGMQTFDQRCFDLFELGKISYEDALRNADSVNDLRLTIKLHSKKRRIATSRRGSSTSTSSEAGFAYTRDAVLRARLPRTDGSPASLAAPQSGKRLPSTTL